MYSVLFVDSFVVSFMSFVNSRLDETTLDLVVLTH
jgi:hypothetical protein